MIDNNKMNITKEGHEEVAKQQAYQDLEEEAMIMKNVDNKNKAYDLIADAERLIHENPNDQTLGGKIRELFRMW
jgi:hypothetical protein